MSVDRERALLKRKKLELVHDYVKLEEAARQLGYERHDLVTLLREVQHANSRALIELPRELEEAIIKAIGRHPRDGDG